MSSQDGGLVDLGVAGTGVSMDGALVPGLANVGDVHVDGTNTIIHGEPEEHLFVIILIK